jgi:hypothetical protein
MHEDKEIYRTRFDWKNIMGRNVGVNEKITLK